MFTIEWFSHVVFYCRHIGPAQRRDKKVAGLFGAHPAIHHTPAPEDLVSMRSTVATLTAPGNRFCNERLN